MTTDPDPVAAAYDGEPAVVIDVDARNKRVAAQEQAAKERAEARRIQREQEFQCALCTVCGVSIHKDPHTGQPYQGEHRFHFTRRTKATEWWHKVCETIPTSS